MPTSLSSPLLLLAVMAMLAGSCFGQRCVAKDSLLREPKESSALTLTLSPEASCSEAWEVTGVDNPSAVSLAGDFKAVPASVFPKAVLGMSDRQSEDKGNGAEALFEKDVFPSQADQPGVWIAQKGVQWVTLKVDQVERPNTVKVYQTINPGGVKSVELIDGDGKATTIFSQDDDKMDTGVIRCGQQVSMKNVRRGTLLELAALEGKTTIRAGNEDQSETPTLFTVRCPKKNGAAEVSYGDQVQLETADGKLVWSDTNNPEELISTTPDRAGVDSVFTLVNPDDETSSSPIKRAAPFAIKSNWNRFLEVTDFTKGDMKFSARLVDSWGTFSMHLQGAQLLTIPFKAPSQDSTWYVQAIRLTVDATKVWRGIDAVELEGIRRVYPKFPGLLYSNNIYLKTVSTGPTCAGIQYRGADKVIKTIRYCWGSPKGKNGKVCSGNGTAKGGPVEMGDACVCSVGWKGDLCDTQTCKLGVKGLPGAGQPCSGRGYCPAAPAGSTTEPACVCETSFRGDACELARGDHNGWARTCSAVGDPHWWTFDGMPTHVLHPFLYTELLYYANPQPWMEVPQEAVVTFTKAWGGWVAIATEVTIRSHGQYLKITEGIYIYHNCGQIGGWASTNGRYGVFQLSQWWWGHARVTTPTGMTVDVYNQGWPWWCWEWWGCYSYLDVHIHIYEPILPKIEASCANNGTCAYDRKGMRGLCGNFDGVWWNDVAPHIYPYWGVPQPDWGVMAKVVMPGGVSFRSCQASGYNVRAVPVTQSFITTQEKLEYENSERTRKGLSLLTEKDVIAENEKLATHLQGRLRAADGETTSGMCNFNTITEVTKECNNTRIACAKRDCHTEFFKKHAVFKSLKEVCDKNLADGKDWSSLQKVTWNAYINCFSDMCSDTASGDKCVDNGDSKEVGEFLDDLKETLSITQKAEKETEAERKDGK
jgi:hypothetical protein